MKYARVLICLVCWLVVQPAFALVAVIAAGDSNTAYAPLLSDVFGQLGNKAQAVGSQKRGWYYKGSTVVYGTSLPHEGYSGRGISYLSARLPSVVKSVSGKKIVVLNIGANDMWISLNDRRPISDAQAVKVAASWQALADQCVRLGADVVAVMPTTPSNARRPLSILRAKISAWADLSKMPLVDLAGCANDGVHFKASSAGYGAVAKRYVTGVKATVAWSGTEPNPEPEPPIPPVTNDPPVTVTIVLETFAYTGTALTPPAGPAGWLVKVDGPRWAYNRWIYDFYASEGMILSAMWGTGQEGGTPAVTGKQCAWAQFPAGTLDKRLSKYSWRYVTGNKYNLVGWPASKLKKLMMGP